MDIVKEFKNGKIGKICYDEFEDNYFIDMGGVGFSLLSLWDDFNGKKVKITIEILEE